MLHQSYNSTIYFLLVYGSRALKRLQDEIFDGLFSGRFKKIIVRRYIDMDDVTWTFSRDVHSGFPPHTC